MPKRRAVAPPDGKITPDLPILPPPKPKPIVRKPRRNQPKIGDRTLTSRGLGDTYLPALYGPQETGGIIVFEQFCQTAYSGYSFLLVLYEISWGELNSVVDVKLAGKSLSTMGFTRLVAGQATGAPNGHKQYRTWAGSSSQAADPVLALWESRLSSAKPGVAYAWVGFPIDGSNYDHYAVTFEIQGRKVRDPRTDATLVNRYYRTNPSLIWADWKTSQQFGERLPDSQVDFAGAVTTTANDCDVDIGGGVKRYTMAYRVDRPEDPQATVEQLCGHAMLFETQNNGKWQVWMDKQQAASGIQFDESNVVEAQMRVKGQDECPTRVRVNFVNISNGYKTDFAEYEDPGVVAGTKELIQHTLEYHGVPSYDQGYRLCVQRYNRGVQDKEVSFLAGPLGARVLPGIVVEFTWGPFGFVNKKIIVTSVSPQGSYWLIQGETYSDLTYDNTPRSTGSESAPTSPNPWDAPAAPTSLSIKREKYDLGKWRLTINWALSSSDFYLTYLVTAQVGSSAEWIIASEIPNGPVLFDIEDITKIYTIRVYAVVKITGARSTALVGTSSLTDAQTSTTSGTVTTSDATLTTLETIAIVASRTYWVETVVRARRTGGAAGSDDDGAAFIVKQAFETIAGVVTPVGDATYEIFRDQEAWSADLVVSGTNVLVQVTGAASNTVDWASSTTTMSVATQQVYAVAAMAADVWFTGDQQLETRDADAVTDSAVAIICDDIVTASGRVYLVEATVVARRQSGDSAVYVLREAWRSSGGVLTRVADPTSDTHESEDYDASFVPYGVHLQLVVRGAASQTVLWHAKTTVQSVSATPPALYSGGDLYDLPRESGVTTTDATPTVIDIINHGGGKTYVVDVRVVARRTGGTAGAADDAAAIVIHRAYKMVASFITQIGDPIEHRMRDSLAWDVDLIIDESSVMVQVTGADNNDITWYAATTVRMVA